MSAELIRVSSTQSLSPRLWIQSITPVPGPDTAIRTRRMIPNSPSPCRRRIEFGYDDAELTDAWSEDMDSAESTAYRTISQVVLLNSDYLDETSSTRSAPAEGPELLVTVVAPGDQP